MTHPAGQGRYERVVMASGDEDEGRRTRTAIQVLVAAADREVRTAAVEIDLESADAVTQVPEHQRPALMRALRDRAHVIIAAVL